MRSVPLQRSTELVQCDKLLQEGFELFKTIHCTPAISREQTSVGNTNGNLQFCFQVRFYHLLVEGQNVNISKSKLYLKYVVKLII